jgi:hypothetical protein
MLQSNKPVLFIKFDISRGYNAGAQKQPTDSNAGKFHMIGAGIQPSASEGTNFFPTDVYNPSPNQATGPVFGE